MQRSHPQTEAEVNTPAPPREKQSNLGIFLVPALLALLVMLPRILDAHFGLLDDGYNLSKAIENVGGDWNLVPQAESGRFRPFYWLFYYLQFAAFGLRPAGFFLVNTLVLIATTLGLVLLVRRAGGSPLHAFLSGLIFPLSVPVIENYYTTFSKGEPLQVFFIIASLLVLVSQPGSGNPRFPWIKVSLASALILLAAFNKETTLVLIPVSLAWRVLDWLFNRADRKIFKATLTTQYFLATVLAGGLFFLFRALFAQTQISGGNYTAFYDFNLPFLIPAVIRWTGWLIHGFAYLAPLVLLIFARALPRSWASLRIYAYILIWMAAWVVMFLPWRFAQQYYLLPFSAGSAVLAGALVSEAVSIYRQKTTWAAASIGCLAIAGVLFSVTLLTNLTNARMQLAVDRANWEMVLAVRDKLPSGSKL